jgi:AcrR family transcriptional regulator
MTSTPLPKAGRGRPARSAQQADASRERIVESARKLFADEGYEGVSMRKIAAMAACSPAALYLLFPNKRQLLRTIWEAVFSDLVVELDRVGRKLAGVARAERICLAFIDFWLRRPDDFRAIFLIEDRLQGSQDHYFVETSDALPRLDALHRAIAEAQARGELRAGDPERIHNILLCGVQGLAINLITIPEYPWGDPQQLKRDMVRTLLAGLR